ncbi:hypothetical protein [Arthrobacter sp. SX1312]|uniref:hypothetical protein n=1 Tax=Arthrobacter sp. SX1312 TaxID=2058896 RepID=UPI000CE3A3F5|nr:hypothetical protein [Arthrobacter sp. SX1312]
MLARWTIVHGVTAGRAVLVVVSSCVVALVGIDAVVVVVIAGVVAGSSLSLLPRSHPPRKRLEAARNAAIVELFLVAMKFLHSVVRQWLMVV